MAPRYSGFGCLMATLIFDIASVVVLFGLRWWVAERVIPTAPEGSDEYYGWILRLCDFSLLAMAVVIVSKLILLPILRRRELAQRTPGPGPRQPPPFNPPPAA
ncbi:MAG: hypothetical protein SFX74_06695 [Fimbriimonadaceae bacterium]|nr:hypothetical protein [Fimbriimonadaceae bacterium]